MNPGAYKGQREVSDPLELDLQVAVTCLMWVLGAELGLVAMAICLYNCLAVSPA